MSAPKTPPPHAPVRGKDFRFRPVGIPCEWAESYRPGGLHPVHFGDVFNNRYKVIRKLGNGSFATVWLALDSVFINSVHRYVALKIEVSKLQDTKQLSIQSYLASRALQDANSKFVVTLLDSFVHDGPNGGHPCLVLEPMGPSVSSILNAPQVNYDPRNPQPRRFPKKQTKSILQNVLCGLRFMHNNGVVHGDLQSGNMLIAIQDLSAIEPEQLSQDERNSRVQVLERVDGAVDKWAPKYLAVSKPLDEYLLPEQDQVVKIIDIGGAFLENDPPQVVVTPAALRAPEVVLGCPAGRGVDIWSFGCLVFEFLTGLPLFQLPPIVQSDDSIDDDHLIQLTDILGPLPKDLLVKWSRATRYYGPDGERLDARPWDFDQYELSYGDSIGSDGKSDEASDELDDLEDDGSDMEAPGVPQPHDSLEKLFRDNKGEDIDEGEEKEIVSLLRSILQYDPAKRPSASDLLQHPWIKT